MANLDAMHRRAFLKRAGAVSALGAGAPLALNLAAAGEAAAFTAYFFMAEMIMPTPSFPMTRPITPCMKNFVRPWR
jgi:hypothetical protein